MCFSSCVVPFETVAQFIMGQRYDHGKFCMIKWP